MECFMSVYEDLFYAAGALRPHTACEQRAATARLPGAEATRALVAGVDPGVLS